MTTSTETNVLTKLLTIQQTASRNEKEALLKAYEENHLFKEILYFTYHPFIVTGISTKKLFKPVTVYPTHQLTTITEVMNYLSMHGSGTDKDIAEMQYFLAYQKTMFPTQPTHLYEGVITKELTIGLTATTINKVYGKFIPTFGVQLAESYEKHGDKIETFAITQKIDGNRCIVLVENEDVHFFTRKGKPIEGLTELTKDFTHFPSGVYDGELIHTSGDFSLTQKMCRKDGEKTDLHFYLFDQLTINEFMEGESYRPYHVRRNVMDSVLTHMANYTSTIHILPVLYQGTDKEMIEKWTMVAEKKGWEGLMVNNVNSTYVTKRTSNLLKVKKMKSADLLCVAITIADSGQFSGQLGALQVEYKGTLVGVGSGFTKEERALFTTQPELVVGKIVEVAYFEETTNEKNHGLSLRFPVFKGIRDDKGIEDIRYE